MQHRLETDIIGNEDLGLMTARDKLADDLHPFEVAGKNTTGKAAIIGIDIEFFAKVVKATQLPKSSSERK